MNVEDEKLIYELCGWKSETKPYEASFVDGIKGEEFDVEFWYSPNEPDEPQPMPVLDLNFYFKYAVPKLFNLNYDYVLYSDDEYHFCKIWGQFSHKHREIKALSSGCLDPAEAFGCALLKLIRSR